MLWWQQQMLKQYLNFNEFKMNISKSIKTLSLLSFASLGLALNVIFIDAKAVSHNEKTENITIYGNSPDSWNHFYYRAANSKKGYAIITKSIDSELNQGNNELYIRNLPKQSLPSSFKLKNLGKKTELIEQQVALKGSIKKQLLEENIGKNVEVIVLEGSKARSYKGTLIEAKPHLILKQEGNLRIIKNFSSIIFSDKASAFDKNYVKLNLYSKEGDPLNAKYSYKTYGITWSAAYDIYLQDESDINDIKSKLIGWANIVNSTKIKVNDSNLKLVAGNIKQVIEQPKYRTMALSGTGIAESAAIDAAPATNFTQEKFSDQYIYKLARRVDISPNSHKKVKLFEDKTNLSLSKKYEMESYKTGNKVNIVLNIENKKDNGLGFAIPGGVYTVYAKDSNKSYEVIGEAKASHKKEKDNIELNIGSAFDISAKRNQIDTSYDKKRRRGKYTISIELENSKDVAVDIVVKELINNNNWKIAENSKPYNEIGENKVEFPLKLKANSTEKITYTVEYKW